MSYMFISSCLNGNAFSVLLIVPHVSERRFILLNLRDATLPSDSFPLRFFRFFVCFGPPFLDVIMAAEASLN